MVRLSDPLLEAVADVRAPDCRMFTRDESAQAARELLALRYQTNQMNQDLKLFLGAIALGWWPNANLRAFARKALSGERFDPNKIGLTDKQAKDLSEMIKDGEGRNYDPHLPNRGYGETGL